LKISGSYDLKKKINTEMTPLLGRDLKGGRTSQMSDDGEEKLLLPKRGEEWEIICGTHVSRSLAL